jgi:hypothetical protein
VEASRDPGCWRLSSSQQLLMQLLRQPHNFSVGRDCGARPFASIH